MPEPKHRRRADVAMIAALLLSIVVFWHWRIATATTKYTAASWDVFLYFAPMYDYIGSALRAGRVPLWNPYQGCGEPLLGVLQGGVL